MTICAVDFSPPTAALVRTAAALTRGTPTAPLLLLHVLPATAPDATAETAAAHLAALAEELRAAAADLVVQTRLLTGCPGPTITRLAAELGATTIVLSAHGAGGISRFLMGSTAETVLRTAPCATLLLAAPPRA